MRLIALLLGAAAAGAAGPAPQVATVEIKDAAAQVTVIPEDRTDIRVEIVQANPRLPLKVRPTRNRTVIDGGLTRDRIRGCRGAGGGAAVQLAGRGETPLRQLPRVVVRAPRDVNVYAGGAVFGAVGRARNLTLGNAGCGDWTLANVQRRLDVSLAGAGSARAGTAGEARLRVSGSGDIVAGEVGGRLDVDVAGSGDVRVASMSGPLEVHVAGSGDVVVAGGRASAMTVSVAGSGDVTFGGVADTLNARIAGSGDVRAREVKGRTRKAVMGSGTVRIG